MISTHLVRSFPSISITSLTLIAEIVTLPLWTPSSVGLGDVGYLDKPSGAFVTLFNAFSPEKSSIVGLPSLYGYGRITRGEQRQDKRGAARRGLDALAGFLTFKSYSYVQRHAFESAAANA